MIQLDKLAYICKSLFLNSTLINYKSRLESAIAFREKRRFPLPASLLSPA
jgi:hypothetical protein